jgi:hypothetical protein
MYSLLIAILAFEAIGPSTLIAILAFEAIGLIKSHQFLPKLNHRLTSRSRDTQLSISPSLSSNNLTTQTYFMWDTRPTANWHNVLLKRYYFSALMICGHLHYREQDKKCMHLLHY